MAMACVVKVYVVIAHVAMARVAMACIVMACVAMAGQLSMWVDVGCLNWE